MGVSHTTRYDSGALVDTQHESCILIRQKLLTFGPPRRTNNLANLAASRVASLLGTGTAGEYSRIPPVRGTRKPVEDPEFVNSRRCSVDREGCLLNRRCVTVHPPAPLRTTSPACNINKRPKMCPSHRCAGLETTTKSPKHLRPSTFETNLTNMHARHTPHTTHHESADQPISRADERGTDRYLCARRRSHGMEKTRTLLRGVLYGVGQRATTGPVPGLAVRGRRSLFLTTTV